MRIDIDKLQTGGTKFSRAYEPTELNLGADDLRLTAPVKVSARVRRDGQEIRLAGNLETQVETFCGRCLKPSVLPVHVDFDERFVGAVTWRGEEQHELDSEDLNLAVFTDNAIELDELVREQILLAVPSHVLCVEDCKGLCPICGIDRNVETCKCDIRQIDSRWEKLRELQK